MTFLLNTIPILICVIGIGFVHYFQFKKRSIKGVVWSTLLTCAALVVYQNIQPSYIPKTGVPPMVRLEIEEPKSVIEDRILKPQMTTKEREEHFENNVLTYDEQIKQILKEEK